MILTDTHTHIYSESFESDQDKMMQRAIDKGVQRFFVPAIDSGYTEAMYAVEQKYPDRVFLMMGLHPTHVSHNFEEELEHVKRELDKRADKESKERFYAVGEIGIDLYWETKFLNQQQKAFSTQIKWAKELNLPIVIHCRDAFDEVFEILEEENDENLFGIFHCFTGTYDQAQKAIDLGFKLGIGGVATFKNGKIDKFLHKLPLSDIVLETDAPYLAPVPYRGKRNESSYLFNVAEKISQIYQMPLEKIAEVTTANSKEIFGV